MNNKKTLITLPEHVKEEMQSYAQELNISLSALVLYALIEYKSSKKRPKIKGAIDKTPTSADIGDDGIFL